MRADRWATSLSHEHLDSRYWPIDAVTEWHANHRDYAIAAHQSTGSDANPVILNYNLLSDTSKQDLIYYLRSL